MSDETQPPTPPPDQPVVLTSSGALVPLLGLAAISVLSVFGFIEAHPPYTPLEGEAALVPYGPADVSKELWKDNPLEGLDAGMPQGTLVRVSTPPLPSKVYPCMDCHEEQEPNTERRELEDAHTKIKFAHDAEHRWCFDCHDVKDRDKLRLTDGTLLEITESQRLCGQCHGRQFRESEEGIHGKRTGFWNGPKRHLQCIVCHDPHAPAFKPMKPLPPPVRPQFLRAEDREGISAATPTEKKSDKEAHHGG